MHRLSFSCNQLEGNNKTGKSKALVLLTMTPMQANIFLLFCDCFSYTYSLLCIVSFFHVTNLKGKNKTRKIKALAFSTMTTMEANTFLLFCDCFSYINSLLSIGGTRGVMFIVIGIGHGDMSSNP